MGLRRARHGTLGVVAMMPRGIWPLLGGACLAATISGCASVGAASGAVAGVMSGTVTANPAVGIGVGIAVQAATDEVINRYIKGLHRDQQDAIAALAGEAPVDWSMPWRVKHTLPLENGHGEVRVTRIFNTALASCKEFVFSVVDGDEPDAKTAWFVANVCQQNQGWKWASVEPAVDRWESLQ